MGIQLGKYEKTGICQLELSSTNSTWAKLQWVSSQRQTGPGTLWLISLDNWEVRFKKDWLGQQRLAGTRTGIFHSSDLLSALDRQVKMKCFSGISCAPLGRSKLKGGERVAGKGLIICQNLAEQCLSCPGLQELPSSHGTSQDDRILIFCGITGGRNVVEIILPAGWDSICQILLVKRKCWYPHFMSIDQAGGWYSGLVKRKWES